MHELTVGQLAGARHSFVPGVIVVEVKAFQVIATLCGAVESSEQNSGQFFTCVRHHQSVAHRTARFTDQRRGIQPLRVVERGLVQGCQDSVEGVVSTHDASSPAVFFSGG